MKLILIAVALFVAVVAVIADEPASEYLPPSQEYVPPEEGGAVGDDGYRYKAVRRVRYRLRHKRDVSELGAPSNEYIPPESGAVGGGAPAAPAGPAGPAGPGLDAGVEIVPAVEQDLGGSVSEGGYRYRKVVRRIKKLRHRRRRRDVSELAGPSDEYLPPGDEGVGGGVEDVEPVSDEGYRYRKVRRYRLRHRHRRDVSELGAPSNEYIPPESGAVGGGGPGGEDDIEIVPAVEQDLGGSVSEDGYRYRKVVRRVKKLRHRRRRDVSELGSPSDEYLPPDEEGGVVGGGVEEVEPVSDEGYRYRKVRRLRLRHRRRRDVSELGAPSDEYLPPDEEAAIVAAIEDEGESGGVADEGYRYRKVRRIRKLRHRRRRRDVSELGAPSDEYLPPDEEAAIVAAIEETEPASEEGYKYRKVRRLRLRRRRRDVANELF